MRRLATALTLALALPAAAQDSPSPEGARVYFVNIADGDTVTSPLRIAFGLEGMEVLPAGEEGLHTGHHHLLIDRPPFGEGEFGAEELTYPIVADDNHVHFGGGQTETEIELAPGTYTLQLVLGDHNHVPHDPLVASEQITVTVE